MRDKGDSIDRDLIIDILRLIEGLKRKLKQLLDK